MNFYERLLAALEVLKSREQTDETIYTRILLQSVADEIWNMEQYFSNPERPISRRPVSMTQVAANRVAYSILGVERKKDETQE